MENWYLPITIIPGLGLLVLSTSNMMIALSNEIDSIIELNKGSAIIRRKLAQLKLLNKAMVFFYIAIASLLISAILKGLFNLEETTFFISAFAVVLALIGLFSLILYSFRAVRIRQDQFINKLD